MLLWNICQGRKPFKEDSLETWSEMHNQKGQKWLCKAGRITQTYKRLLGEITWFKTRTVHSSSPAGVDDDDGEEKRFISINDKMIAGKYFLVCVTDFVSKSEASRKVLLTYCGTEYDNSGCFFRQNIQFWCLRLRAALTCVLVKVE